MSSYDYSGIDPANGRVWGRAGWGLFSIGILLLSVAAAIVLVHVLVVFLYGQALAQGEQW